MTNPAEIRWRGQDRVRPPSRENSPTRPILLRAATAALILGSVLTLANQPNAIAGADAIEWLPLALVYVTPFIVVAMSQILGMRRARDDLGRPALIVDAESFPRTVISHGIPARAIALGLVVGTVNSVIAVAEALLSGQDLQTVPAALLIQALSLPILFGAVSQATAYRRYLARAHGARRVSSRSRA